MLRSKSKAIPIRTIDYLDNPFSLQSFKGSRIFLTFFRDSACTFCNIRLNELIQREAEFTAKDIQIITFFGSSKEDILEYAHNKTAPFPIIPDPELIYYKLYGVRNSIIGKIKTVINIDSVVKAVTSKYFNPRSFFQENIIPAEFLINEELIIDKAYYGNDFSDHQDIEDVLNWKIC